jgi:hypothetical protein
MKRVALFALIIILLVSTGCRLRYNVHSSLLNKRNALNLPEDYTFNMSLKNEDMIILHKKIFNFEGFNDFIVNPVEYKDKTIRVTEFLSDGGVIIRAFFYEDDEIVCKVDNSRKKESEETGKQATKEIETFKGEKIIHEIEERVNSSDKKEDFFVYKLLSGDKELMEVFDFPTRQGYKLRKVQ